MEQKIQCDQLCEVIALDRADSCHDGRHRPETQAEYVGAWLIAHLAYDLKKRVSFADNAEEAHSILERIFTLNLSCLVFTFGSMLVAIQVAGGQYPPRMIATTLLRDNVIRWIVGLFVFSLLWTHRTMAELGQSALVAQMQVFLATTIGLA